MGGSDRGMVGGRHRARGGPHPPCAPNLAFAFVAVTIVVVELGGRGPGLATAVTVALSLNFFLTEPYLTLAIEKPGDSVASLAMAACGVIAAAFGERRVRTAGAGRPHAAGPGGARPDRGAA